MSQATTIGPSITSQDGSVLLTLEEIGRVVSQSGNPAETLANIVQLIQWRFSSDVCSIYLLEPDRSNLVLAATVGLRPEGLTHTAAFTVRGGDRVPFVLTWYPSNEEPPEPVDAEGALADTERYWRGWIGRCGYEAEYREAVHGSLIVLKALTYGPTGGLVAAPTTSLPERIGGDENWDYRFCWLRDATFTLYALLNAGFDDDARRWRDWLLRAVAGDPARMQPLYGVGGWAARYVPQLLGLTPAQLPSLNDQLRSAGQPQLAPLSPSSTH